MATGDTEKGVDCQESVSDDLRKMFISHSGRKIPLHVAYLGGPAWDPIVLSPGSSITTRNKGS